MASNGSAAFQCYRKGRRIRQPLLHADPPDLYPRTRRPAVEATLMSESLRNDGRIWVPKKLEDVKAIRSGAKKPSDIAEEDRDYYLERRYPAFGNLVPRDVASRAAKERCDAGYGVNETGLAVFLDFKTAIERLGKDIIKQRYGNLFRHVRGDHRRQPLRAADADLPRRALHDGRYLGGLQPDDHDPGPVRHRRGQLLGSRRQPSGCFGPDAGVWPTVTSYCPTRSATTSRTRSRLRR